jgi:hypothetical protein
VAARSFGEIEGVMQLAATIGVKRIEHHGINASEAIKGGKVVESSRSQSKV